MKTGFDGSMIDQLLETAEDKKEKEDEELEIEKNLRWITLVWWMMKIYNFYKIF